MYHLRLHAQAVLHTMRLLLAALLLLLQQETAIFHTLFCLPKLLVLANIVCHIRCIIPRTTDLSL